eukprot:806853-Amphidinium_carterae.1
MEVSEMLQASACLFVLLLRTQSSSSTVHALRDSLRHDFLLTSRNQEYTMFAAGTGGCGWLCSMNPVACLALVDAERYGSQDPKPNDPFFLYDKFWGSLATPKKSETTQ